MITNFRDDVRSYRVDRCGLKLINNVFERLNNKLVSILHSLSRFKSFCNSMLLPFPEIPNLFSLRNNTLWDSLSNALQKSR